MTVDGHSIPFHTSKSLTSWEDSMSFLDQIREYEQSLSDRLKRSPPPTPDRGFAPMGRAPVEDRKRPLDLINDSAAADDQAYTTRKKKKLTRKECTICCIDIPANRYPKAPHTLANNVKKHCRAVCFPCYEKHISSELESKDWNKVTCPGCSKVLEEPEIKKLDQSFTGRVYQKWLDKAAKAFTQDDEEFQACPTENCDWGCFMSTKTDGNIFRCQMCKYRFCIICKVTMHEDETCDQYQDRRLKEQHHKDDLLSTDALKKCSKPCPGCGINLDKYTGCDHVTCRKCKHEFCWLCFAPYGGSTGVHRIGNAAHKQDCKYHPNRLPAYAGGNADDEDEVYAPFPL